VAGDESYRLPRHARPLRYELELQPDLVAARFDGRVSITVEVLESSDRLVLHAADLEIARVEIEAPDTTTSTAEVALDEPNQMLILTFADRLAVGTHRLTIEYSGLLNDQLRGFYRSTFRDEGGAEQVIATTQFEASDARRAFPCWDEPDFKAVFSVTLVVDEGLTGISNGRLESLVPRADGRVEMRFSDTMAMSTYLVAFIVGPYDVSEADVVEGVPIRIAAVRGRLGMSSYAAEVARHSLTFLSGYFGIPYPGGKLDHVAVPDFAFGAMENLGCVTYRERLLLVDPDHAAQTELQNIATVVAHETSHMWFGNLVTMKWWDGIWLNEAFATFMELTTSDDFRPEWQVWTTFGAGKAAAFSVDGLRATRPVEYPVGRPEEAEGMFDVLTYQKGGSVLRMLEQYIGPEVFRKGIAHYLSTHAYSNTETADLWDAIETVSGEPVRNIMATWILQGGYPVIGAAIGDDPTQVLLRQERFLYSAGGAAGSARSAGSAPADLDPEARWAVPVNLRASIGGVVTQERLLLEGGDATFTFAGPVDWVVVNDGAWGYYRVQYSEDLWRRLAAADPVSVLAPLERLQLVGDTWAGVVSDRSDLVGWAAAASAVAADPDPDVWGSLGAVLRALELIADDRDRAAIEDLARRLARSAWEGVGWDPRPGESDRTSIARGRIMLALAGPGADTEVIDEASRRFRAHLADPAGGHLAPDLIRPAGQVAVAHGGADAWSAALAAYQGTDVALEQLRYLYALTETPLAELRVRTLEMTIGPDVRSQDAPFVIGAILSQPRAAEGVWAWLESHWDAVAGRFPSSLTIRMLEAVATVVDAGLAERIRTFCRDAGLPVSAVRLEQVLERVDPNPDPTRGGDQTSRPPRVGPATH
jgi:puromycin-sensitive aminopeptidase